ncbi:SigE family RNA polymerase sigma factor [Pengzhenrongella frigida]|uniref:SigE family RNA polymerase sigma factor n=1 Tax=Pengzhenrongella frigida TaxID=1259133 RepID=A0A4Q5N637_9MICO|nr:SigE family RNA polymerase sigma factor [Cellulomonas sp. HLT2-17]RYV51641.1 SigE family RNA polymerase sigma factor [Cellulomonas sp. HLT2-17]
MSVLIAAEGPPDGESTEVGAEVGLAVGTEVIGLPAGAGDRDAEFTVFMERAAPGLARTAWLLCGDEHRAEELVQQALMRTYLSWSTARQRDPLAYTRRTLANLRIDTWRKRRREVLMDPRDVPEGAVASAAEGHAERDQLVRALATLSTRQRRIVVLRHLDGLSEREVAADLGVSVGTVKSTASRGMALLRSELDQSRQSASANTTGTPHPRSRS